MARRRTRRKNPGMPKIPTWGWLVGGAIAVGLGYVLLAPKKAHAAAALTGDEGVIDEVFATDAGIPTGADAVDTGSGSTTYTDSGSGGTTTTTPPPAQVAPPPVYAPPPASGGSTPWGPVPGRSEQKAFDIAKYSVPEKPIEQILKEIQKAQHGTAADTKASTHKTGREKARNHADAVFGGVGRRFQTFGGRS